MNSAIVLAGGIGSRINSKTPKQFLIINNKLILEYSINIFEENTSIKSFEQSKIVASTPGARKLAKKMNIDLSSITPTGPSGRISEQDV